MTIHRFGSPEAALAHVECDTCTIEENRIKHQEELDVLHASGEFLGQTGTGLNEAERMALSHEEVIQGRHRIILFQHDVNHPLSKKDAVKIKQLDVNSRLAKLVDAYAKFGS